MCSLFIDNITSRHQVDMNTDLCMRIMNKQCDQIKLNKGYKSTKRK